MARTGVGKMGGIWDTVDHWFVGQFALSIGFAMKWRSKFHSAFTFSGCDGVSVLRPGLDVVWCMEKARDIQVVSSMQFLSHFE